MKRSPILVPLILWILVVFSYVLRRRIDTGPVDIYFTALFVLPIALIVFRKISFADLGLKVGKPFSGLFFVFLLPVILFLRLYFIGGSSFVGGIYFPIGLVLGSIAEEFFFRGYLQEQLRKSLGANVSIGVASFLFMLVHVVKGYSFLSSLGIFLVGSYFGLARDKQGGDSVIYSMGAHSFYNLVITSMQKI